MIFKVPSNANHSMIYSIIKVRGEVVKYIIQKFISKRNQKRNTK